MFNRIVNFFRDVRMKIDFSIYEKQCRLEHERRAEATHSTHQLESELSAKSAQIQRQAHSLFLANISHISSEISQLNTILSQKEVILKILTREYSNELQELYSHKSILFSQKTDAFNSKKALDAPIENAKARKDAAYASVSHYKCRIESWHAKSKRSPWLFGTSGKKLPNHSLFGQSFGDLESYKCQRDAAYREVQDCKEELGRLFSEKSQLADQIGEIKKAIDETDNKINTIKSDRSQMYALKKAGNSKTELQKIIDNLLESRRALQLRLSSLMAEQSEFIIAEQYRQGVVDIENKIQSIKNNKKIFLKTFDSDSERKLRIKYHRQLWLQGRGLI